MKKVVLVVLVAVLVAVGFAYAAANTVPVTGAGDGQAAISGYNVTGVHYILKNNDPTTIVEVTFTMTPKITGAPADPRVKIKLKETNGNWYPCTYSGNSSWSCQVTGGGLAVSDADELRVVAAQ